MADKPPPPKAATGDSKQNSRAHYSTEDQEEFDKLDGLMDRLKKAVPPTPYILSVPTEPQAEYRHRSPQEAHAWMIGHLFRSHEADIQYRSYLYREPYSSTLALSTEEQFEPQRETTKPRASTTPRTGPRKVISLKEFKNKGANGVSAPGSKLASPNLPPSKPTTASTNGVKDPPKQVTPREKQPEVKSQKR